MSTRYLTFREVRIKIENITEEENEINKLFVTKEKLISYNLCNNTLLEKYNNTDLVIDDDIIALENLNKQINMVVNTDYKVKDIDHIEVLATGVDTTNTLIKLYNNTIIFYAITLNITFRTYIDITIDGETTRYSSTSTIYVIEDKDISYVAGVLNEYADDYELTTKSSDSFKVTDNLVIYVDCIQKKNY